VNSFAAEISPQFSVQYNLTEDFPLSDPVGCGAIFPIKDSSGVLHVIAQGTDSMLYDVYQDSDSETGWSTQDMHFPNPAGLNNFAAGVEQDGTLIVFASDTRQLYFVREGWGTPWTSFSTFVNQIGAMKTASDKNGVLIFAAQHDTRANPPFSSLVGYEYNMDQGGYLIANTAGPSQGLIYDWAIGADAASPDPSGLSTFVSGFCDYSQTPAGPAGIKSTWYQGPEQFWARGKFFFRLALAQNPARADDSVLFAIDTDSHLCYYDGNNPLTEIGGATPVQNVCPFYNADGQLAVIAHGQDMKLYHATQTSVGGTWTEFVVINDDFAPGSVSSVVDRNGDTMFFCIGAGGVLSKFWQDNDTGDWEFETIELGVAQTAIRSKAYVVRVTALDANGGPLANAPARLWSSAPLDARVNGLAVSLDVKNALNCVTDATGRLTIVAPADTLHTPVLTINVDGMAEPEGLVIEPNADIQAQLGAVDGPGLLNAKATDGAPMTLLTGEFATSETASAIAQAVNQAMLMAGAGAPRSAAARLSPRSPSRRGVRLIPSRENFDPRRIDLSTAPDTSWTLVFDANGLPVFTPHDAATAAAKMAERRASCLSAADTLGVDWSDIWNSFTSTVSHIVEVIVEAVVDQVNKVVTEIKAQIILMVNGARHFFDATIDLVEQAFDMVEGFFHRVGAAFETLFDWLGYLFNFDDIKRTAQVISHVFSTSLDLAAVAATTAKDSFDASFDSLEENLRDKMEEFIAAIAPRESVTQAVDPLRPPMPGFELRVNNNFLLDAVMNNIGGASNAPLQPRLLVKDGPLDVLGQKLQAIAQELQTGRGKQAFDNAAAYFGRIPDDPGHWAQLAFAGLLEALEGVILFGLEIAKTVVDLLLDAISTMLEALKALLDEDWKIPLVSEIYEAVTGQQLTFKPLDLLAMIVAIPATPIYKIMDGSGKPPFNDEDVKAFKAWFTVDRFKAFFDPGGRPQAVSAEAGDFVDAGRKVMHIVYATNFVCRAVSETMINVNRKPDRGLVFINILQRFLASAASLPWALSDDPGGLGFGDSKEFSNSIWLMQLVLGPCRGLTCWALQAPQTGDATLALWGGIHLTFHALLLYEKNSQDPLEQTEDVLVCLAPQLLKLLRADSIVELTRGFSLGALGVMTALSEPAIAGIHLARVFKPEERLRLAAPAFADRGALSELRQPELALA
jgi:hypothetical protein